MKRLTLEGAIAHLDDILRNKVWECEKCKNEHIALKTYLEELKQYKDLEEQGKLIKLPCKVGDTVYAYCNELGYILSYSIEQIIINYDDFNKNDYYVFDALASSNGELLDAIDVVSDDIGKTVFLTIEEAEAALKKMEGDYENNN